MVGQSTRGALIVVTILSLGASPANACNCLNRWFGTPATTTYYAPAVAVAPAPCAPAPQVVNYVPQTSYRTVYMNMPVVAYQPVTTANPCTGCATTVMRPVTSYVTQARLVPYTSYRPVVTAAYAPVAPACGGCAAPALPVTAAYAPPPAIPVAAPAPAPASCCTAGYAPATAPTVVRSVVQQPAYASATPIPAMAPATTAAPSTVMPLAPSTTPSTISAPSTGAPTLNGAPSTTTPSRTFEESPSTPVEPQSRLIRPQSTDAAPASAPRSLDPEDQDRTTYLPRLRAFAARPVSLPVATSPSTANDGWRAGR